MKTYNCTVRLSGSPLNEVPRSNVTAAEVFVLRSLHGDDAVRDITHVGELDRDHNAERDRLADVYGPKVTIKLYGETLIATLPDHVPGVADAGTKKPGRPKKNAPEGAEGVDELFKEVA